MVSEEFTRSLVHVVEANGEWSGSSHHVSLFETSYRNSQHRRSGSAKQQFLQHLETFLLV